MTKREYYNMVAAYIRDHGTEFIVRSIDAPSNTMRPIHVALLRLALRKATA